MTLFEDLWYHSQYINNEQITPIRRPEANIIFNGSAEKYADIYSEVTIGYRVSEGAVTGAIIPHIAELQKQGKKADVLEVGGGTGQSSFRIKEIFKREGLANINLVTTEYNRAMIQAGQNLNTQRAERNESEISFVPMIQATAEALPFRSEKFDVVYGSQVIHWIGDIPKAFREAHSALKPGGILAHAGSGIIEGFGKSHFTEDPAYKIFFGNVEQELRNRGYWNDEKSEFNPKNKLVNPFFHRYKFEDINKMLSEAGFDEIGRTYHAVPVNKSEMLARMSAGAASMFIFAGEYAKNISEQEREEVVDLARKKVIKERPDLLDSLDKNPTGDPSVLFKAKKPLPKNT